jgi:hypothetical protein
VAFVFAFLSAYAGPALVGSITNIAVAIAFRLALSREIPGFRSRIVVCVVAGVLGGLIAVAESLVFVEVSGLWKEAAGFALLFVPVFLAPTAVAASTWVLDGSSSGHGGRSGWALLGAVAGAAIAATGLFFSLEHATRLSRALWGSVPFELSRFAYWSLVGMPLAVAAMIGSASANRIRTALLRVERE